MSNFIVKFQPRIGGGGVITYRAGAPYRATYWRLTGIDGEGGEIPAHGSLKNELVLADGAGLAANIYISPKNAELVGSIDRVIVVRQAD